jgi:peptide-methionine (S)-S-oxide reductase
MFGFGVKPQMVDASSSLPGRREPVFTVGSTHAVFGTAMDPRDEELERIYLAMGCFWGAEEIYWQLPGVVATSVGYMGGYTPHPTYEEVCTGLTGHTETVFVAYRSTEVSTYDILKIFWESHDPTQGFRQGNDVGTQYRSAIFYTNDEQHELAEATRALYADVIAERGYPKISTEIEPASKHTYYLAEDYHQQYLYKVPNGYRCHANTGLALPALSA